MTNNAERPTMTFDAQNFPIASQSMWHTGPYIQWQGGWYQFETVVVEGGERIRIYQANITDPDDRFAPLPNPTRAQAERYEGYRDVPASEVGATINVDALCVWKDIVWSICGATASYNGDLRLQMCNTVPVDYPNPETAVTDEILANWPGIEVGWSADHVQALIRPVEATLCRTDVTPYDPQRRAWVDDARATWWTGSLVGSPFLAPGAAIEAVKRFVVEQRIELGDYRIDQLEVSRLRDGWRVWCPPPPVEGPGDLRFGWAVFYVADDGYVVRSSTQQSLLDASQELSNGLLQRLLQGRQIVSSGPGGIEFPPTVLTPGPPRS